MPKHETEDNQAGDVVSLHGSPIPLDKGKRQEFVVDMARFAEGDLTEKWVRRKYRFDAEAWEKLGGDDRLVEEIEAEKLKRIRSGDSARERAQIHFAAAPNVLGDILNDQHASPRHRIESAKELRVVAANGPKAAPATERFQIIIDLGDGHIERYDKPLTVNVNEDPNDDSRQKEVIVDDDPHDTDDDTIPQELFPVIAMNKIRDGGSGEPL
jgi:hypothetical protein